jgi:adenine-specific DNA-methyltransferase
MYFGISNRRYTGSKFKLADWIRETLIAETKGKTFADIFAGTGVVTAKVADLYDHIYVNDFLYSNYAVYQAFMGPGKFNQKKLDKLATEFNQTEISELPENYFSTSFGDKYFSHENAKLIGHIREYIEENKKQFTQKEYYILLASLMYSADKIANTVGHYDAFFAKVRVTKRMDFRLVKPLPDSKFTIYREDTNELVRRLEADVVYIDPPYNSRQYSRFYHILENLIKWEKPELFGVALKPPTENVSVYSKTGARAAFEDLITNLKCKYIVVSYNNTYNPKSSSSRNKIEYEDLEKILKAKGSTKVFSKSHQHFNSGKTDFVDHREYLFVTKVDEK